jgi:hypothetical protein
LHEKRFSLKFSGAVQLIVTRGAAGAIANFRLFNGSSGGQVSVVLGTFGGADQFKANLQTALAANRKSLPSEYGDLMGNAMAVMGNAVNAGFRHAFTRGKGPLTRHKVVPRPARRVLLLLPDDVVRSGSAPSAAAPISRELLEGWESWVVRRVACGHRYEEARWSVQYHCGTELQRNYSS